MVVHRRKELVPSRRRVVDEGEEEAGSEAGPLEDDSMSDATALSELDEEDGDADGSDISEQEEPEPHLAAAKEPAGHGPGLTGKGPAAETSATVVSHSNGVTSKGREDTNAMLHGLSKPAANHETTAVDFDRMRASGAAADKDPPMEVSSSATQPPELPHERRRREQEDYNRRRDADPTFVPNRGGFFMHDHRHAGPAANGFRPFGRGRGRGAPVGAVPPSGFNTRPRESMSQPWSHDLHEAVAGHRPPTGSRHASTHARGSTTAHGPRPLPDLAKPAPATRSFSKSTHVSNVQIRVFLPPMTAPIIFSAVPVWQYTRLPQHRPPLRRDKAVRILLPASTTRFVFPSPERSFIFIPRAFRPHPPRFGRTSSRAGYGSHRAMSSRRTSAHGGSLHTTSAGMSRRSSMTHDGGRDGMTSRADSTTSRAAAALVPPSRPVVRLPPAVDQRPRATMAASGVTMPAPMIVASHPAPRAAALLPPFEPAPAPAPAYRQNAPLSLPMHQPRPQKTVSVAGFEPAEMLSYAPPSLPYPPRPPPPFHQQVPLNVHGGPGPVTILYPAHTRDSLPLAPPGSRTPLPQIPERAIHAPPFQPQYVPVPVTVPAPAYYAPPYHGGHPAHAYFYPPADAHARPSSPRQAPPPPSAAPPGPLVVVSMPPSHPASLPAPPPPPALPLPLPLPLPAPGPAGTVAQESNGMVYYYDAAQIYGAPQHHAYPAATTYSGGSMMGVGVGVGMGPAGLDGGYLYPGPGAGPVYYGP
ncbi:MAG: hypothetical protein M1826_006407 [Phylliscum demangeonii]|nr:MAG: hypothetical protein M1826_006407 [Phylliscum demangeonii]